LVGNAAAVGNDEREPRCPGLCRHHAKRLRLAAVDQGIGAGEECRKFATIAQWFEEVNVWIALCVPNDSFALTTIAQQHKANGAIIACRHHCIDHHRPTLLRRVAPHAQGTDARQQSRNLLLSESARMDTKPQLEIFADDVKCTHGATVGQLDEEQIFYLRSRGLGLQAARDNFIAGFERYGIWIILIKGLTPIPYKLVTIASGAAHFDLFTFVWASIVTRGVRFFVVAALLWKFGEPIRAFIEKRLTLLTWLFLIASA